MKLRAAGKSNKECDLSIDNQCAERIVRSAMKMIMDVNFGKRELWVSTE